MLKKHDYCFIAAEISANHGQNFGRAVKMIRVAKKCGADAVKFQTYTPDTLTLDVKNRYFTIKHPKWGGQTLYELYQKAYTPWRWFKKLKKVADNEGIAFFSTAFDRTSVDFLEDLGVFCHKIASFELVDIPLIEYMARTRKPLILSTGMASLEDIRDAVTAARRAGAKDITLLKCVSSYPADPHEMNLRTIPDLRRRFEVPVGLSDHTLGTSAAITAVGLGATFIEKHFILSRKIKTPDSFFSIEPEELKSLVQDVRIAEAALGKVRYGLTPDEKKSLVFRRSIFVVADIRRGETFTEKNIRSIRPANGLKPKCLKSVLGRRAKRYLPKGTPLRFQMIA
jgi:pseudaminic acid synthase